MTNYDYDFNTAEALGYELIPAGTIEKVIMRIKRGGYNDASRGWDNDFATRNYVTDSVYLACEYTIIEGKYKGRKIWSLIGLYSNKNGNLWGNIGRSYIRSILNSAHGFTDDDRSEDAITARKINSFADLDGIEFIARIDIEKDANNNDSNIIKTAITPEHKDYQNVMSGISSLNHTHQVMEISHVGF